MKKKKKISAKVAHAHYRLRLSKNENMVKSCSVPKCGNRADVIGRAKHISFFKFPKNDRKCRAWIQAIGRKNWAPTSHSSVCSEHFEGGWHSDENKDVNYAPTIFTFRTIQAVKKLNENSAPGDTNKAKKFTSRRGEDDINKQFSLFAHSYSYPASDQRATIDTLKCSSPDPALKSVTSDTDSVTASDHVIEPSFIVRNVSAPDTNVTTNVTYLKVPSTTIIAPVTSVPVPVSFVRAPGTNVMVPVLKVNKPVTNIKSSVSNVEFPETKIESQVTNVTAPVTKLSASVLDDVAQVTNVIASVTSNKAQVPKVMTSVTNVTAPVRNIKALISDPLVPVAKFVTPVPNFVTSVTDVTASIMNNSAQVPKVSSVTGSLPYVKSLITGVISPAVKVLTPVPNVMESVTNNKTQFPNEKAHIPNLSEPVTKVLPSVSDNASPASNVKTPVPNLTTPTTPITNIMTTVTNVMTPATNNMAPDTDVKVPFADVIAPAPSVIEPIMEATMEGVEEISCSLTPVDNEMYNPRMLNIGTQCDPDHLYVTNAQLRSEIQQLKGELKRSSWGHMKIMNDDVKTKFYTGLSSYNMFLWLYNHLITKSFGKTCHPSKVVCYKISETEKRKYKVAVKPIDQFLAVLMRNRLGLFEEDISNRIDLPVEIFSKLYNSWISLLHEELKIISPFSSREEIYNTMSPLFRKTYPSTRIILHCMEISVQSNYSVPDYKLSFTSSRHYSMKFLLGITLGGIISFVSEPWSNNVSERQIAVESGVLELLEPGDNVMAHHGFDISDHLGKLNCTFSALPYGEDSKCHDLSLLEGECTQGIIEVFKLIDCTVERIRDFKIFHGTLPSSLASQASKLFQICCWLANFDVPPPI